MGKSTYLRIAQAAADHAKHRRQVVEAKFKAAKLNTKPARYPADPSDATAKRIGFRRGSFWAFEAACRGETLVERFDIADSTAAGNAEQEGWNAAVAALQ